MAKVIKKYKSPFFYKKFIRLKLNFLYKNKIYRFRKSKWEKVINYLKRVDYRKKFVKKYDYLVYYRFKFSFYFTTKFKNNLFKKQKLKYYYGYLKNKKLKKDVKLSINKFFSLSNKINNNKFVLLSVNSYILQTLESKLYMIIYRSFFASSVRKAKQLIRLGNVLVNNKKIITPTHTILKGDIISFKPKLHNKLNILIKQSLLNNETKIIPTFLKINYSIFKIILIGDINKFEKFNSLYPYLLETNYLLKHKSL